MFDRMSDTVLVISAGVNWVKARPNYYLVALWGRDLGVAPLCALAQGPGAGAELGRLSCQGSVGEDLLPVSLRRRLLAGCSSSLAEGRRLPLGQFIIWQPASIRESKQAEESEQDKSQDLL